MAREKAPEGLAFPFPAVFNLIDVFTVDDPLPNTGFRSVQHLVEFLLRRLPIPFLR
jgi:hypothetical protein